MESTEGKNPNPVIVSPIERHIVDQVYDEFDTAKRNNEVDNADFEAVLDLLECRRNERDYEWMSDVFIPEYPSLHLTEASQWANQYFQTRDFVDVYLEGDLPEDKVRSQMVKKYINVSLNQKEVYHFIKYMRTRGVNSTRGVCYALVRWERETEDYTVQTPKVKTIENPETGVQSEVTEMVDEPRQRVVMDRFNYDPIDPRNVYTDNRYVYSLQEKEYVIIRDEVTYEQLTGEAKSKGYQNLSEVKKLTPDYRTQTETETTEKFESHEEPQKHTMKHFDRLLRFGKMWATVTEREEDGYPRKAKPGIDDTGSILASAELIETIVEEIFVGNTRILIRFQPTPYRTSKGKPYRPILRGLCYVHPTKDVGMSDGKYARELQVALNDTINMSNDRTKLATLPTLKGQSNAVADNDQIYFEPEHIIPLPNVADLEEMTIKDDVRGAMAQADLFIKKMQQVNSVYPGTMGEVPGFASTTATAVAGAESRANLRANYKSLTFEYTFLVEFYWMMLQMAYQFMHPETAVRLWGRQNARLFDPDADYSYQPVSSNVEQEYSKDKKVKNWDQLLGRVVGLKNPAIVPVIAYIIAQECMLLGGEYRDVGAMLMKLAQTPNTPEGGEQPKDAKETPTSNQTGNPMSMQEESARGM